MKILKTLFLFGVALILITSCASSYKNISPDRLAYSGNNGSDQVVFSYRTNVLETSGNRKYAKKEMRSKTNVVAVKITNNSDKVVTIGENAFLKSGAIPLQLLSSNEITQTIRQSSAAYLLYLLLTPMQLTVTDYDEGTVESYPIGYGVGPGLALLNMGISATANSSFEMELNKFSLINKKINPGETTYGLIGLKYYNFGNIVLEVNEY